MFQRYTLLVLLLFAVLSNAGLEEALAQDDDQLRSEEATDYFEKWLKEDVVYIIMPDERDVFGKLTTDEEKEQFIEQFWYRRDPDMLTAQNEFKEEHYRRIAYANETFHSGEPGWMTDRGRVYIIHGPPDQIESHPNGGVYYRKMHEGGGQTSTYPFEVWWYRYMEGVGSDVELEFVDRNGGNQYKLALDPNYKDALLHVQDAGPTLAEEMGVARKEDRPFFSPQNVNYPLMWKRGKDDPFMRYETFAAVKRPTEVKYKDLQEIVSVNIEYNNLPFEIRQDFFRLNDKQVLVPITVEWKNKDLTFEEDGRGFASRIGVYGMVTSLQNRIVSEFEDEVSGRVDAPTLEAALLGRSMYQKVLVLDMDLRYKLDIVVKDLSSGQIGAIRQAIIPPKFEAERLAASSMLLADFIEKLDESFAKQDQMFVLGDIWIRPSMSKAFSVDKSLGVYFQLYNFGIDQSSLTPRITAHFKVSKGSRTVLELTDDGGESVHFFSGSRIILIRDLQVNLLEPGDYRVEVRVEDLIKNEEILISDTFKLTAPTG